MMNFKKKCCNPYNLKKCSKALLPIRPSIAIKLEKLNVRGSAICSSCNIKISKASDLNSNTSPAKSDSNVLDFLNSVETISESESESEKETDEEAQEGWELEKAELINALNSKILPALRLSPIAFKKMSSKKYAVEKLQDVSTGLKTKFGIDEKPMTQSDRIKAQQFDEFLHQAKTKFLSTDSKCEKYQILTILPASWSARKIESEFGCSFHMANSSKKLQQQKGVLSTPNPKLPSNILSNETKEIVKKFYEDDDISRIMAGKNDYKSMLVNGKKVKVQKRMMLSTLNQSYQALCDRYPEMKISLSSFVKARPKNCVFLGSSGTHNVCVCTIHQNVIQMLYSAKICRVTNGEIKNFEHCIHKVTCNPPLRSCFLRVCPFCPKMIVFKKYLKDALKGYHARVEDEESEGEEEGEELEYEGDMYEDLGEHQAEDNEDESDDEDAEETEEENEENDGEEHGENDGFGDDEENEKRISFKQWTSTDRCEFEKFTKTISEFVNYFALKLEKLIVHSFIAREQARFLKDLKENLKYGEFVIGGDFSENFKFVIQNEAQGYYWSKKQATIHPFSVYYKNEKGELEHLSYVIISECLKHDSVAVHLFITKLIKFLETKFKTISKLIYFTDGCSGQYKNRKNFLNVYCHKIDFGYECEWHFHATAHGKGPCDGLGGTLKRAATRASLGRTYEGQIDSAKLLFDWASSSKMDIEFGYSTTAEYKSAAIDLKDRFNKAVPVKGTLKFHSFVPALNGEMQVQYFSSDSDYKIVKIINN